AAQVTGESLRVPLLVSEKTPLPSISVPVQTAFAVFSTIVVFSPWCSFRAASHEPLATSYRLQAAGVSRLPSPVSNRTLLRRRGIDVNGLGLSEELAGSFALLPRVGAGAFVAAERHLRLRAGCFAVDVHDA